MTTIESTIVAAKEEYTKQLLDILTPVLYTGFQNIWETCKAKKTDILVSFQLKLENIAIWNQNIIDNEYARAIKENHHLDKLIEAIFLANIKMLSVVRLGKAKTIDVNVPNSKKFIHECYIESARKLWKDPFSIDDREDFLSFREIQRNMERCYIYIDSSIKKTISDILPTEEILDKFLTDIDTEEQPQFESEPISRPQTPAFFEDEGEDEPANVNETTDELEPDYVSPVDNVFMEEPPVSRPSSPIERSSSPEYEHRDSGINLDVSSGHETGDTEEASENNNYTKSIILPESIHQPIDNNNHKKDRDNLPFFDSDEE